MSRWAAKKPEELPQSAEEYEAWFTAQVQEYKRNPFKQQLIPPKGTPSAWQMEGLRLVMAKREKQKERWDW